MPSEVQLRRYTVSRNQPFFQTYKESGVDDKPINLNTRLEEDLGIYGDDAIELMLKYAKKYKVDVTKFEAANYFSSEAKSLI